MKSVLILGALIFPLLLGGTACSQGMHHNRMIVRVKDPGERSGYLGVSIQDMTRRLAKSMDVKTDEGALVTDVVDESPAEEAGVKDKDIIIEIDGKKINDSDELRETIRETKPGTKVNLVVMRKDERKTLTATIEKQPRSQSYSYSYTPPAMPRMPRMPRAPRMLHGLSGLSDLRVFRSSSMLGMELSELNKQLGKYFDAPDGKGVLVNEVEEDSKAAKAGLQAGDVITKFGKETVEDVRDVEYALRDFKEGEKADVEIIRKGTKKTLTIEVPDMDRPHRLHWGSGDNGLREFDFDIDEPEVEYEHESFKNDIRKLELELRGIGKEIQSKARKLQQELKAKLSGVMS